jgi:hypothetical protein
MSVKRPVPLNLTRFENDLQHFQKHCQLSVDQLANQFAISTKRHEQRFYAKRLKIAQKRLFHVTQLLYWFQK